MNTQILELRSKLSEIGIKTISKPESISDNTLWLYHNQNGNLLFQAVYQTKEVWGEDSVGYCIGYGDGESILINSLNETINFISNLKK